MSALVHSSTLVTAGVFLLVRFFPFIEGSYLCWLLGVISCLTMLIAGLGACVEVDMKKIIALSTLRQLGIIIGSIRIGLPKVALFHLVVHALFKALLFICCGIVIHFNRHDQDLRKRGRLIKIPLVSSCFSIANIALCGVPFLAAFYSKDIILEYSIFRVINIGFIMVWGVSTSLTSIYTFRFFTHLLWGSKGFSPLTSLDEDNILRVVPLVLLALGGIVGGAIVN